jgi:hypothetical protein
MWFLAFSPTLLPEVSTAIARPNQSIRLARLSPIDALRYRLVSNRPSVKPALEPRFRHFASMKAILDNPQTATTFPAMRSASFQRGALRHP